MRVRYEELTFKKKMLPTLLRGLSKISQGEYKMLHTARILIFINH